MAKLMKQIHGLENIRQQHPEIRNIQKLAELLVADLQHCYCDIYGCIGEDDKILLAKLSLISESLLYDMFDQRIDFCVFGPILRADTVPLTYHLQGRLFGMSGRCSIIPRVCGVDLYLQRSYTGVVNDIARQKFSIAVKPLLNRL